MHTKIICRQCGFEKYATNHSLKVIPKKCLKCGAENNKVPRALFSYFDKIDTEEKAYWLGFIAADGHNNNKDGVIRIVLAVKDVQHLFKFAKSLKMKKTCVKIEEPRNNPYKILDRLIVGGSTCTISIHSKWMSNSLLNLGITQNKSLSLALPTTKIVPLCLMRHYIRGYFDGDGCITSSYSNYAERYRVIFVGSVVFCQDLAKLVRSILNINIGLWNKPSLKIKYLGISGNRQVLAFMDWMYKDSTISLDRKYLKYQDFIKCIERIDNKIKTKYSKYKNISWDKNRNKWIATVRICNKTIHVGRYATEELALEARVKYINTLIMNKIES